MKSKLFLLAKLNFLINKSNLSKKDKQLWFNNVSNLDPEMQEILLYFLDDNPDKLAALTEIIKEKIEILKTGNFSKVKNLLKKEAEILKLIK